MIKKLIKIYQAIADFILFNLRGNKAKWGDKEAKDDSSPDL